MARLQRNSVYVALQGTIGKELVFKHYSNKVVVAQYPDMSKVKPSEGQKEQRTRMKEANDYARFVLRNPELKAIYEKHLRQGETVDHKAKKNYFEKKKGN